MTNEERGDYNVVSGVKIQAEPGAESRERAHKLVKKHVSTVISSHAEPVVLNEVKFIDAIATAIEEARREGENKRDTKWQGGIDEVCGRKFDWNAGSEPTSNTFELFIFRARQSEAERDRLWPYVAERDELLVEVSRLRAENAELQKQLDSSRRFGSDLMDNMSLILKAFGYLDIGTGANTATALALKGSDMLKSAEASLLAAREALKPFAAMAEGRESWGDVEVAGVFPSMKDVRAAKQALQKIGEGQG